MRNKKPSNMLPYLGIVKLEFENLLSYFNIIIFEYCHIAIIEFVKMQSVVQK